MVSGWHASAMTHTVVVDAAHWRAYEYEFKYGTMRRCRPSMWCMIFSFFRVPVSHFGEVSASSR
jgi:hypothetical protein